MKFSEKNLSIGLGLRSALLPAIAQSLEHKNSLPFSILELAPENWCGMGGAKKQLLNTFKDQFTFYSHGLSLSLGGQAPLDFKFLEDLKNFFKEYPMSFYSEHLSFCSDDKGLLYDLLPVPFNEATVLQLAERIRRVQDFLERRIAVENNAYYVVLDSELSELEFIQAVLDEGDCDLLLDVNNVYVNSINHHYEAEAFIKAIASDKIAYMHVAGHERQSLSDFGLKAEKSEIIIDTHAYPVPAPVWDLLDFTYRCHGVKPTILECDNHIPTFPKLCEELERVQSLQTTAEVLRP